MLTFDQIKELIDLVAERQLQGVEIERAGLRVKIEGRAPRAIAVPAEGERQAPVMVVPEAVAAAPSPGDAAPAAASPEPAAEAPPPGHVIKSPIVGTFYTAPAPDADPYVQVGDRVKKGQVLCIIEAMKLMNEIESDVDGIVKEVHPKNAQPVEFGEPLFLIETS